MEIESAGLRSLRTRVRISPDALADVAQPGRRAAPRTLFLEVQILSSAFIAGMAQCGGRGGLKNRKLWVRIPLPALNFVGVAQREERERAMLEAGSSNLLAHFKVVVCFSARLAEWMEARGRSPRQVGSIPAPCFEYSPKWRNRQTRGA